MEIRQRQTKATAKSSDPDDKEPLLSSGTAGERAAKNLEALAICAPASIAPYLLMVAPYIGKAADGVVAAIPLVHRGYEKYLSIMIVLQPYRLDLLFPSLCGLIMCFFGGSFFTLIAAVEAYKLCGYETSMKCLRDISEDYKAFCEANAKDDAADADGNGVADVLEISAKDLAVRKTMLFMKSVDPQRLTDALTGLNSGFLAVVATLKLQFCKSVTLGNAIGDIFMRPAQAYVKPAMEMVLPNDYKKWAGPIVTYMIKSTAISIAWFLQRVISAFHSAIRGGHMVGKNILVYLGAMNLLQLDHSQVYLYKFFFVLTVLLQFYFKVAVTLNKVLKHTRILYKLFLHCCYFVLVHSPNRLNFRLTKLSTLDFTHAQTYFDELVASILALTGLWFQLSMGY